MTSLLGAVSDGFSAGNVDLMVEPNLSTASSSSVVYKVPHRSEAYCSCDFLLRISYSAMRLSAIISIRSSSSSLSESSLLLMLSLTGNLEIISLFVFYGVLSGRL